MEYINECSGFILAQSQEKARRKLQKRAKKMSGDTQEVSSESSPPEGYDSEDEG